MPASSTVVSRTVSNSTADGGKVHRTGIDGSSDKRIASDDIVSKGTGDGGMACDGTKGGDGTTCSKKIDSVTTGNVTVGGRSGELDCL